MSAREQLEPVEWGVSGEPSGERTGHRTRGAADNPVEQAEDELGGRPAGRAPRVVVIGAGVSGCACAATLAVAGVPVTVVSSALDMVGLPAFGGVLAAGHDCVAEVAAVLKALPEPLRSVWVDAASVPSGGSLCVAIDRRMVSVETKRALEQIGSLCFRQAFVVGVRVQEEQLAAESEESAATVMAGLLAESPLGGRPLAEAVRMEGVPRFVMESAFGELLEADVLVLAPGLSLGGTVSVGGEVLSGGRYGETPSDGLRTALEHMGARWGDIGTEVGPSFLARGRLKPMADCGEAYGNGFGTVAAQETEDGLGALAGAGAVPFAAVAGLGLRGEGDAGRVGSERAGDEPASWGALRWPGEYPRSPYCCEALRREAAFAVRVKVRRRVEGLGSGSEGTRRSEAEVQAVPDGLATDEVYVAGSAGTAARTGLEGFLGQPTRVEQVVAGRFVANLDVSGRLKVEGLADLWVCGRAAGARDYLESLSSGVRVGGEIVSGLMGPRTLGWGSRAGRWGEGSVNSGRDPS